MSQMSSIRGAIPVLLGSVAGVVLGGLLGWLIELDEPASKERKNEDRNYGRYGLRRASPSAIADIFGTRSSTDPVQPRPEYCQFAAREFYDC